MAQKKKPQDEEAPPAEATKAEAEGAAPGEEAVAPNEPAVPALGTPLNREQLKRLRGRLKTKYH